MVCAIFILANCTKKSNSSNNISTTPNKLITASFPHIDTATLWNVANGQRTGAKAIITSAGVLTITGYQGSRGTYAGGTYNMELPDTSFVTNQIGFNLYQYGPDTIVSKNNFLQIFQTTGWARSYYSLWIYSGNLPDYAIVAGQFIDSI